MTQNSINNSASSIDIDNITVDGNTISSTDTNGNIILAPDGSGTVSVTAAPIVPSTNRADSLGSATNAWDNVYCAGLTFDAGTTTIANYVDGVSFTPELAFGGESGLIEYSNQTGTFTRIGSLVWFELNIILTDKGTDTGNCTVEGLPFTVAQSSESPLRISGVTFTGGRTYVIGTLVAATTSINIQEAGSALPFVTVQDTAVVNTSQFFLSGVYRTSA